MDLPDYGQLSKWLTLFGQNIAMAMVMALIYAALRPAVEGKKYGVDQFVIGALFGCGAIVSTTFPIQYAPGVLVDMRNVFILVGSLAGGAIGAVVAAGIAILYRLYLGGIGVFIGVSSAAVTALLGFLIFRYYGARVRQFGIAQLVAVGLGVGIVISLLGRTLFAILGIPPLPMEATIATILLYSAATALMGSAVNMIQYNVWRQTQRRLVDVLETTSDFIWETDSERRITFVSDRYRDLLGYGPSELMGQTGEQTGGRWLDETVRQTAEAAMAARKPYDNLYFTLPTKDGSRKTLLSSGRPRFDERGKFIGYRGTATDVSELIEAEAEVRRRDEQLRVSHDHLTLAQGIAGLFSGDIDLLTGKATFTDTAYKILGLDLSGELVRYDVVLAHIHPEDRSTMEDIFARALRGEDTEPVEFRFIQDSGKVIWLQRIALIRHDGAGKPTRVVSTYLDITQRKHAEAERVAREAELLVSREHLARAQRLGRIGSAELNLATGAIVWSDGVYDVLGLDPATTKPGVDAFLSVIHPDDRELASRRSALAVRGEANYPLEYRLIRPNGEIRWVYFVTEAILGPDGVPTRMLFTVQDVTDVKTAQEERAELERQLTQAQKMEAVGNLTGGIAHDFNNLLSVILGRLEMSETELQDRPQVREWIRSCINAANRGASLTRSMLAFSRQQPLQPSEIDISTAINDLSALLPRLLGEAIEVSAVSKPDLWRCEADAHQLQNALLNLALNARDAMPNGGNLTIGAENAHLDEDYAARNPDVVPGDYAVLSVSDTGVGMSAEVISHAFEPFFTTKEVGKGSGLGLSMVYGFAKQSGGHVGIYSELGLGTTVRLYLPRAKGAFVAKDTTLARPAPYSGSGLVLVIEDDEDMRALAVALLERLGYRVRSAGTGHEALKMIDQSPEALLLLTDLTLPSDFNGRDLARRALERLPHLRVLYMSGYSQESARLGNHFDSDIHLLQKPFGIRDLSEALHTALL